MNKFAVFVLAALCAVAAADHYAVLIAGSSGFSNYRHQADICHAYHVLINAGMPADNIILFSYDDVASSSENPLPNTLYNKPGDDSIDYNKGCVKDYTGNDVTPENFIAVLTGEASKVTGGSGKVLKSTQTDKVFINFVDHGAPGLIAFPEDFMYADQLNKTLTTMHEKKMYSQLTFYLEACESGSMFNKTLPDNINIYATTAANPSESSWATYCSPNNVVKGTDIGACLGDLYSVNWMEDSDSHNVKKESLATQFTTVKKLTTQSHVQEYGTKTFKAEPVADFQGNDDAPAMEVEAKPANNFMDLVDKFMNEYETWAEDAPAATRVSTSTTGTVDSRDVKLQYLTSKLMKDLDNAVLQQRVIEEITHRKKMEQVFASFTNQTNTTNASSAGPIEFECYRAAMSGFRRQCFNGGMVSDYGLKFAKHLVAGCSAGVTAEEMENVLASLC